MASISKTRKKEVWELTDYLFGLDATQGLVRFDTDAVKEFLKKYAPGGTDDNGGDSSVPNHNNLNGLQGGAPDQFYHVLLSHLEALEGSQNPGPDNVFVTESALQDALPAPELTVTQLAAINAANNPSETNPVATIEDLPVIPEPELTASQQAAINGANNPSADNVLATMDDIPAPTPEYDPTIVITNHSTEITLDETSGNEYKRYTGATDINVTVPNTIPTGRPVTIRQAGAGVITLVGDVGMVINGPTKTAGQDTLIQAMKVADNLVDTIGGVE
jgi:hypothetical protein